MLTRKQRAVHPCLIPAYPHRAYTLVELLVVIAVITMLASMLIPVLQEVVEFSRRVACLNDRKQNYIALKLFCDDHRRLIPAAIGLNTGTTFEMGETIVSAPYSSADTREVSVRVHDNKTVFPQGTLIWHQYIPDPRLMFCPAMKRYSGGQNSRYNWDWPVYRSTWLEMTDQDANMGGFRSHGGIANFFYIQYGQYGVLPRVKLNYYAERWRTGTPEGKEVSSLFYSCANWAYTDPDAERVSHRLAGVNGVFFDGSGRWILREEVAMRGWQKYSFTGGDYLSNHYPRGGYCNMQPWARKYATPAKP